MFMIEPQLLFLPPVTESTGVFNVEDVEESYPKSTPVLSTDYTEPMGAVGDDSETKSSDIEEIKKP